VKSNRDAIGAVIRVTAGTEHWTHWINAGDGYQSSNDRRVLLGLGKYSVADEVQIQWPSGFVQTIKNVPANQEQLIIEGRAAVQIGR
jgi:hypothetical protein